jgi:hypothetical protein
MGGSNKNGMYFNSRAFPQFSKSFLNYCGEQKEPRITFKITKRIPFLSRRVCQR